MATKAGGYRQPGAHGKDVEESWPIAPAADEEYDGHAIAAGTVEACDAAIRQGFLRKVFGIVASQLLVTAAVCAVMMLHDGVRTFVLTTPSMLFVSFLASMGFLFAAHIHKDAHPTNLQLTLGFTLSMAWSVGAVCARFYAGGMGLVVLEAVGLTASVTVGLTAYTLRSKRDFSFMGAGLGAGLWLLLLGGLVASLAGSGAMHFALAVGGAFLFSLYIIYVRRDRGLHSIPARLTY